MFELQIHFVNHWDDPNQPQLAVIATTSVSLWLILQSIDLSVRMNWPDSWCGCSGPTLCMANIIFMYLMINYGILFVFLKLSKQFQIFHQQDYRRIMRTFKTALNHLMNKRNHKIYRLQRGLKDSSWLNSIKIAGMMTAATSRMNQMCPMNTGLINHLISPMLLQLKTIHTMWAI